MWRLAPSQSVYSESGPAVHFCLWITVHTRWLIPIQNGFTGAGRKQFIALTSLLKIWTNCKPWLSHMGVKEMWSRPHTLQLQDVCAPVHACVKASEIDHVIPLVHISPCTPSATAELFPLPGQGSALQTLGGSQRGTSCSPAAPERRQPKLSHRHLLCCRPSVKTSTYSLLCGPDAASSPHSRGEGQNSQKIYIIAHWPGTSLLTEKTSKGYTC